MGLQTLNDRLVVLLGIVSVCFCLLLNGAKCLSCQEILCSGINFCPILETLAPDDFIKHSLELDPSLW